MQLLGSREGGGAGMGSDAQDGGYSRESYGGAPRVAASGGGSGGAPAARRPAPAPADLGDDDIPF